MLRAYPPDVVILSVYLDEYTAPDELNVIKQARLLRIAVVVYQHDALGGLITMYRNPPDERADAFLIPGVETLEHDQITINAAIANNRSR